MSSFVWLMKIYLCKLAVFDHYNNYNYNYNGNDNIMHFRWLCFHQRIPRLHHEIRFRSCNGGVISVIAEFWAWHIFIIALTKLPHQCPVSILVVLGVFRDAISRFVIHTKCGMWFRSHIVDIFICHFTVLAVSLWLVNVHVFLAHFNVFYITGGASITFMLLVKVSPFSTQSEARRRSWLMLLGSVRLER